jgi:hypothetical protein
MALSATRYCRLANFYWGRSRLARHALPSMQESEAAHYKDAERIEGTLEVRKPLGSAGTSDARCLRLSWPAALGGQD